MKSQVARGNGAPQHRAWWPQGQCQGSDAGKRREELGILLTRQAAETD